MGQQAAKQPIRVVLPADETDGLNADAEDDEEEHNIDKLGVSAEESDYPEPRPPLQELPPVKNDIHLPGNVSGKTEQSNTLDKIEEEGTMFSTKSFPEEDYQVELVPVGASFQKSIQRHVEVNSDFDSVDESGKKTYPVVKTITRSLSLRDSLIGSGIMTSSGFQPNMTKREAMLAERERHEYLNLIASKASEADTHRGQFRRFHLDYHARSTHTVTTDKFRSVEDRVADEIADKHRDHRAETYESLVNDLTADINSERLKVKIILAWISKQSIGRLQFGRKPPSPDTPNGYMMLIQEGQGTFPVFFALLCRATHLKCAIISGISKGTHYEVGSKDTEMLRNTWNAVYVEGSWQLVHPLWVCKGIANRQLSGWLKIEEEGKAKRKLSVTTLGRDMPSYNPYYIFTKPEEFVYRNFPDEERWQLLQNPLTLDKFLEQAYIRPIFFMNNFKLNSEYKCTIASENGEPCEVKIDFPKQKSSDAVFGYDLSKKIDNKTNERNSINEDKDNSKETDQKTDKDISEENDQKTDKDISAENDQKTDKDISEENDQKTDKDISEENDQKTDKDISEENDQKTNKDFSEENDQKNDKDISEENDQKTSEEQTDAKRYVMVRKSEGSVTFEVRFFSTGTYKLRLYGGYFKEFGNKPPWIVDVLFTCNNVKPELHPLPFDPGPVGWGPGPTTESFGLYVPSHVESDIHVTEEEDTIVYFILHHKVKAKASLHHCKIDSDQLQKFIEIDTVPIGDIITLQIRLMHPGEGEYGLQIHVRSHRMDVNICNYIVQTTSKRPFETFYPRRARRMILDAMETCDIDFFKAALDECQRTGIPDTDPDVKGARNRFEFLSCKTELYVALLVNRIDVSEHALYRTRKANLDILLAKEMMKVEEHLQKLLKLDEGGWTCDIPEIDRQSLVELSELRKPKLEVRLVITAMYMLLGIEEENLKDWRKVKKFLRNQQSTLVEIARLEKYLMLNTTSDVTVSGNVIDRVLEILANYTVDNIRRVDNTAAAYFQWVTSVTEKLKDNQSKQKKLETVKNSAVKSAVKSQTGSNVVSTKESVIPKMTDKSSVKSSTVGKTNATVMSNKQSAITRTSENATRLSHRKDDSSSEHKLSSNKSIVSDTKLENTVKNKSYVSVKSKQGRTENHDNISQKLTGDAGILKVRSLTKELKSNNAKSIESPMSGDELKRDSEISSKASLGKKSQASNRPELLSKRSGTFVQESVKSADRKTISRKESNVTTKSVMSNTATINDKGKSVINGSLKDDISGKTFFSDGKGSKRNLSTGHLSRPGSKRQN